MGKQLMKVTLKTFDTTFSLYYGINPSKNIELQVEKALERVGFCDEWEIAKIETIDNWKEYIIERVNLAFQLKKLDPELYNYDMMILMSNDDMKREIDDMKNKEVLVLVGNVKVPEAILEKIYTQGKYICTYAGVYQIFYSDVQRQYYTHKVIEFTGYTQKGKYIAQSAEEVNKTLKQVVLL